MTYVFFLLLLLLYVKWLFLLLLYPLHIVWGIYMKHPNKLIYKIISIPTRCVERILRQGGARFLMYHISMIPSIHLRRFLYKGLGVVIEPKVIFHFKTEIRAPWLLRIGKGSIIGDNAIILDARRGLFIGRNVNLSSNVSVYTLQHNHRDIYFRSPQSDELDMSVRIDDRVWLGANVIVLPGVHIGEGAVCCAGCVVTKDVEPFTVVAGIPAKKVGERPRNLLYEFDGKSCRLY